VGRSWRRSPRQADDRIVDHAPATGIAQMDRAPAIPAAGAVARTADEGG
jgi:hypothetical protein